MVEETPQERRVITPYAENHKWIIFACDDYEQLRQRHPDWTYPNLDSVVADIEYVKAGAIGLGASWDDIIVIKNGDINQFEQEMKKLFEVVNHNRD